MKASSAVGSPAGLPQNALRKLATYASFVKIEHTVFSIPLVLAGALLPHRRWPNAATLALVLIAAASCRVIGMALNRIIDAAIDARNPRTQRRELACGAMTHREAWTVVAVAGLVYVAAAWTLAPICLTLAWIPVVCFAGYPYLKRFTAAAHLGLGLAWSLAPVGGWLAVAKTLDGIGEVGWLWFFSLLWVAGFDIIYATMDEAFDRREGLHSLPVKMGKKHALQVAVMLHVVAFLSLYALWRDQFGTIGSLVWLIATGAALAWEHIVADRDPEFAFFKLNGAIGFLVFGLVLQGILK